jgi:hypothetical protein
MTKNDDKAVLKELKLIAKNNGGSLLPAKVVEFAEDETTALHDKFEWNNDKAGHSYRLWQARQLISVMVTYLPRDGREYEVRTFHSLTPDRRNGGGYREVVSILKDKDMRKQLLDDALAELKVFEQKFQNLEELTEVFTAIRNVRKSLVSKELVNN